MRIAQIAPLSESVPPRLYGGTERVVAYLTEELVRQGHEVTLFASGDSLTSASLVPCCDVALRLNPQVKNPIPYHVMQLDRVRERADDFDILHFHNDFYHCPLFRDVAGKTLTTLHGRLDLPDLPPFYAVFPEFPLVSISDAQRAPMPPVNWAGTVLHGLPRDLLPYREAGPGGYLAFLGRIAPEKRPDRAIEIAVRAGMKLKIAAKVDPADAEYWAQVIKPMVDANPLVEYVGEVNERQKASFLGQASALLFPIDWPEPFGLVMIESMACGTPVLAFRCGSVPEVIEDGVSGVIVDGVEDAVGAVQRVVSLNRRAVRAAFDRRFTVETMAARYVAIYEKLARAERRGAGPAWKRPGAAVVPGRAPGGPLGRLAGAAALTD